MPDSEGVLRTVGSAGIVIRHAMPYEKRQVLAWIDANFGTGWASEADVAFSNKPVSCILATDQGVIVGFACYEATCRGYFGPAGVLPEKRGRGIGTALLFAAMHGIANKGYAYAIIGGAGPIDFYARTIGATPIPDSDPGIYVDRLKQK